MSTHPRCIGGLLKLFRSALASSFSLSSSCARLFACPTMGTAVPARMREDVYGLPRPELVRSDNALYGRHFRVMELYDCIVTDPPYGIRYCMYDAVRCGDSLVEHCCRCIPAQVVRRRMREKTREGRPSVDVVVRCTGSKIGGAAWTSRKGRFVVNNRSRGQGEKHYMNG